MSGVIPWEQPLPDCSDCKWYTNWLIDFPCRDCRALFTENKTTYFEQKEERILMDTSDLESKIGQYKRAVETYNKAFGLHIHLNNRNGKTINVGEIDFLMEINQKIIDTKNELIQACQEFIDEA